MPEAEVMSNVTYIKTWTLHYSSDDEWEALCGDPNPQMLAEPDGPAPQGYFRFCKACAEVLALKSSRSTVR